MIWKLLIFQALLWIPLKHTIWYCMHHFLIWLVLYHNSAGEKILYPANPPAVVWHQYDPHSLLCFICAHFLSQWAKNEKPQAELNPKCCIFERVISQKPVDHFRREQCTFSQLQLPFILHGIQEAFLQFLSRLVRVQTNNRNSFCTEKQKL